MEYSKLRGLIKEKGLSESELAKRINLSPSSLSCRLNGKIDWTVPEVRAVCDVLNIDKTNIGEYFFIA